MKFNLLYMKILQILLAFAFINSTIHEEMTDEEHEDYLKERWENCKDFDYHSLQNIAENIDERRAD